MRRTAHIWHFAIRSLLVGPSQNELAVVCKTEQLQFDVKR
jgi:hypothetical protein